MKTLLLILLLATLVFAQDKPKDAPAEKVKATNEQSLEVANLLLSAQVKAAELRALKAEAIVAEADLAKLNERVKPLLDAIMEKLKLDKAKYVPSLEEGKLVFVLKPEEKKP
jgi:hypothetical protein